MGNIVLTTARAAGTGTGDTFVPYKLAGDTAEFRVDGTPYAKAIRTKRVAPISSKNSAGVYRGEVTFVEYVTDAAGVKWPMVYKISTSVPAFVSSTDAAAFCNKPGYVANDTWVIDALARQLIAQS